MTGQEKINNWGIKKYNLPEGTQISFEMGTRGSGYCETCYYEEAVLEVLAKKPGEVWPSTIDTMDTDLASMLIEIMGD